MRSLPRVYFCHIPKTAGSAFGGWLRKQYPEADCIPVYLLEDLHRMSLEELRSYRCYSGHFGTALQSIWSAPVSMVTLVRHPVEATMSWLKFCVGLDVDAPHLHPQSRPWIRMVQQCQGEIAACLRHEEIRRGLGNWQCRYLNASIDLASHLGSSFKEWIDHLHREQVRMCNLQESDPEFGDRAIAVLEKMDVVGLTERFAESVELASRRLGLPANKSWETTNANRVRGGNKDPYFWRRRIPPGGMLRDLESLLQHDLALYEWAEARMERDLAQTGLRGLPRRLGQVAVGFFNDMFR